MMAMAESEDKPLVILHGKIRTPPFSEEARRRAGFLLRMLQRGESLSMPDSRPMPSIALRCHELRVRDGVARITWRIFYRIDSDAIVVSEILAKKSQRTPAEAIARCRRRLRQYDDDRRHL
jgi:phage-related protein